MNPWLIFLAFLLIGAAFLFLRSRKADREARVRVDQTDFDHTESDSDGRVQPLDTPVPTKPK
jgi:LPXTG-motif cell wall-anchored protein